MIRIFKSTERDFTNNGLQILDRYIMEPVVEEVLNGIYQFSFKISTKECKHIEEENIVVAPTPDRQYQPFRIKQITKSMGHYTVVAFHIFYDLMDNLIEDINIVGMGAQSAIKKIEDSCVEAHPFSFFTDIDGKVANCRIVRYNPVYALIGNDENTFINRWGGELYRDNFKINVKKRIGRDSNVVIRYRKNLLGYEGDVDFTQVATKIMPKGSDGILLPEKYIVSDKINNYYNNKIKVIEYSDVKIRQENSEEGLSENEAFEELRKRAKKEFKENHIDEPRANYKVNFIDLSKTKEYKKIKMLERVNLGDRVRVIHEKENLSISARVVSYKYNPLKDSYIEIELGNYSDSFSSFSKQVDRLNEKIETGLSSILEEAKENSTNLIKNGFGGHVKIYPDRILIMDTDNENTAKNVWQWNKNGFAFSSTGINGQYGLAMTMDGSIVADYITSGSLNAKMIKAGLLSGKNFNLDLDSGKFRLGENDKNYSLLYDGSTLKFGDSSIKSENLDEPLKEELKGESSFTHIVYADNGDEEGTFFIEPKDHKWIGIAVTDDPIRPILKSDYKWSKYTGEDGKRGPKGEDGRPGKDGSLAQLPESLKNWDSKSTEINGKYVYTPELFVGTDRDSTYNRTGIYMGDGIRTGEGFISGICGLSNGNVVWKMTPTGAGYIGFDSNRRISWSPRGEVNIPKIRSSDIETKAITTDLLYPGNNNRIVLERGYSPGSNNCKSIDANGSAIRLKVDADTYISMRDSGIVEMYSRNGQFFKFDPRESWYYNGHEGDGWLVLHDAHVSMGWLEYSVYSTRSDRRLKENIKYIKSKQKGLNRENIFDFIKSVDLATYRYKKTGGNNISMIAQDVEEFKFIKDYLVGKNKDGIRLINTGNYTSMMHIALQEEIKKREVLEDKVKSQEARIKRLEKLLLNGGENHVINGNA